MKSKRKRKSYRKKKSYGWMFVVAILILAIFVVWNSGRNTEEVAKEVPVGRTKVLPNTLSPSLFRGKISEAYEIAKDEPELLAKIFCYCYCEMDSLLICYVDDHAANCSICMNEAFVAKELYQKGYSIEDIQKIIDSQFGG